MGRGLGVNCARLFCLTAISMRGYLGAVLAYSSLYGLMSWNLSVAILAYSWLDASMSCTLSMAILAYSGLDGLFWAILAYSRLENQE